MWCFGLVFCVRVRILSLGFSCGCISIVYSSLNFSFSSSMRAWRIMIFFGGLVSELVVCYSIIGISRRAMNSLVISIMSLMLMSLGRLWKRLGLRS